MDETVSGGGAEIPQRAGEISPKTDQAEEWLCLGGQQPLSTSRQFSSSLCSSVRLVGRPAEGAAVHLCIYDASSHFSLTQQRRTPSLVALLGTPSLLSSGAWLDVTMKSDMSSWCSWSRLRLETCRSGSAKPRCFKHAAPAAWGTVNSAHQMEQFLDKGNSPRLLFASFWNGQKRSPKPTNLAGVTLHAVPSQITTDNLFVKPWLCICHILFVIGIPCR